MSGKFLSRFFLRNDPRIEQLVFPLPPYWWSRFYEYEWARQFCEPADVALDAGCGICHPFKFYLADVCREVHACDIDERILSPGAILSDILKDFGYDAARFFPMKYFKRISYVKASITDLPYEDKKFDKIYCISVIEHLPLKDIMLSLKEFRRTLKDDGLLLLTLDYPSVDLAFLRSVLYETGLAFAGDVSFELSENALYSETYGLYCFRAVLRKEDISPVPSSR
ncbi:ubiquinone/menaquinone biosynthesis C-methylase UbiE [Desulfofundulus luciae]|uniref:Ubiquinone/menaquinone biosynthesis C-methylase UbiE n=1 Tax=Desulfofundulus luciae TaxID=74702 RepID=A0ABU0AY32_9FIRM|nr:class I SAM-dependent methyltransferase [Desulfofundulus luciae]MDQ0284947.1 ubiquinone/menaquinone biosynthesis C-methylase UbiE [Desulfofundulus luciae]